MIFPRPRPRGPQCLEGFVINADYEDRRGNGSWAAEKKEQIERLKLQALEDPDGREQAGGYSGRGAQASAAGPMTPDCPPAPRGDGDPAGACVRTKWPHAA